MTHLKRQKAPKNWPVARKGTTYIIRPRFNINKGIPILIILRDILKLARNRKEVKRAMHFRHILLNNKVVRDEKNSAQLYDIITIIPMKKNYVIELSEKGKFKVRELNESELDKKIAKIIDKKILKGKKTQLNLSDGRNFLSDVKCMVNDSVLINLGDKKIEKCLPLKENAKIIIFAGKHSGEQGIVNKINQEKKLVELSIKEKKRNVLIKQLMVIE